MKITVHALFIVFAFSALFVSCKKDSPEENNPTPQKKCYLVKGRQNDPKSFYNIIYDQQMRVDSANSYTDSNKVAASKFVYHPSGQIMKIEMYYLGELTNIVKVDYNADNTVRRIMNVPSNGDTTNNNGYTIFSYNSNKKVIAARQFGPSFSGGIVEYQKNTYTRDASGNITHSEEFFKTDTGYVLSKTMEFLYDTKANASQSIFAYANLAFSQNHNNILKETAKDTEGNIIYTLNNTYSYTAEGNVTVKKTDFSSAGNTNTYFEYFEYLCQ